MSDFSGILFTDSYWLQQVLTSQTTGLPYIGGTDLDDGGTIVAARIADLTSQPFPYDFALLDPGSTICDLFVFSKTGANTVAGADVLLSISGGVCGSPTTGLVHSMTGTRYTLAMTLGQPENDEQLRIAADQAGAGQQQTVGEPALNLETLRAVVEALQDQAQ